MDNYINKLDWESTEQDLMVTEQMKLKEFKSDRSLKFKINKNN